ncbi:hypothetical protein KBB49_01725 [Candidatus Saccharibacteria bacterium]|nr:hypothetical protein [Candidatus Saccharibacteria bacterium]
MLGVFKSTKLIKQVSAGLLALFLLAISLNGGLYVSAQEEATQTGGSGLSISPTRTELSVLPGATDKVTVSIKNITSGAIFAEISIDDFEPDNETGAPKIITNGDKNSASISGFVTPVEGVRLEPDESKDIVLDVSIPNDAAPGGYYGAVRFKAVPVNSNANAEGSSEVSLTANLLSLVLIEVPGDITQKVAVNSLRAYLDDKSGVIFTKKPNFLGIEIENLGNSFIKPFGTVTVSNFLGSEVFSYELNDSNPRSNVLPSSTRLYKDALEDVESKIVNDKQDETRKSPISMPGRYTVVANVSYGNGGEVFTVRSNFWYLPVWFIVTVLVVVLALVLLGVYLYRKYVTKSTKKKR